MGRRDRTWVVVALYLTVLAVGMAWGLYVTRKVWLP